MHAARSAAFPACFDPCSNVVTSSQLVHYILEKQCIGSCMVIGDDDLQEDCFHYLFANVSNRLTMAMTSVKESDTKNPSTKVAALINCLQSGEERRRDRRNAQCASVYSIEYRRRYIT